MFHAKKKIHSKFMHGNLTHEGTSVTVELAQVFFTNI